MSTGGMRRESGLRRRSATLLLTLLTLVTPAWGDWHDHLFGHHGQVGTTPPDPQLDSLVTGVLLILVAGAGTLLLVGPFLLIYARRIRTTFSVVSLVNALIYASRVAVTPYPGGIRGRLRPPGLWYTLGELLLLLLLILLVASVLAAIQWVIRRIRGVRAGSVAVPSVERPHAG
jgi:hypothetical protein